MRIWNRREFPISTVGRVGRQLAAQRVCKHLAAVFFGVTIKAAQYRFCQKMIAKILQQSWQKWVSLSGRVCIVRPWRTRAQAHWKPALSGSVLASMRIRGRQKSSCRRWIRSCKKDGKKYAGQGGGRPPPFFRFFQEKIAQTQAKKLRFPIAISRQIRYNGRDNRLSIPQAKIRKVFS